jgi:cell division protease FtsH
MITRCGMDEALGYIAFEAQRPRFLDTPELASGGCRVAELTQARIDPAIRAIVMGVFERTLRILEANRAVLDRCAQALLARETLDEDDIRRLAQGLQREPDPETPPERPQGQAAPSRPPWGSRKLGAARRFLEHEVCA